MINLLWYPILVYFNFACNLSEERGCILYILFCYSNIYIHQTIYHFIAYLPVIFIYSLVQFKIIHFFISYKLHLMFIIIIFTSVHFIKYFSTNL